MEKRMIVVSGSKVALARMIEADQPSFQRWLQSSELRDLIDDPRIPTLADQHNWFKRVQEPDRKFFSLLELPDFRLIGNCGFVDIDKSAGTATLRITIGHPEARGKGFGTEAVNLLIREGFDVEELKVINLKVLAANARAIRAYEKSGFKRTGEHVQDGKSFVTMSIRHR